MRHTAVFQVALCLVLLALALFSSHSQAQIDVTAAPGDNLVKLLRKYGASGGYEDLQPLIEETVRTNPQAFRGGDPNRLIPFSTLRLPLAAAQPPPPPPPPPPATEPPPAGRITVTAGSARVGTAEAFRQVSARDAFHSGETVRTAPASRATLRFSDGGEVELGPSVEFRIEEYRAPQAESPGRAVLTLLRGAIRAISGAIGKRIGSVYRMQTATATIGIRGTEYVARFCTDNCGDLLGASVAVAEGSVVLANESGELALAEGEFGRVERADVAPVSAPLPEGFFDLDRDVADIVVERAWFERLLDTVGDWFR